MPDSSAKSQPPDFQVVWTSVPGEPMVAEYQRAEIPPFRLTRLDPSGATKEGSRVSPERGPKPPKVKVKLVSTQLVRQAIRTIPKFKGHQREMRQVMNPNNAPPLPSFKV